MRVVTSYTLSEAEVKIIVLAHLASTKNLHPKELQFITSTESREYGPGVDAVFKGATFEIEK